MQVYCYCSRHDAHADTAPLTTPCSVRLRRLSAAEILAHQGGMSKDTRQRRRAIADLLHGGSAKKRAKMAVKKKFNPELFDPDFSDDDDDDDDDTCDDIKGDYNGDTEVDDDIKAGDNIRHVDYNADTDAGTKDANANDVIIITDDSDDSSQDR